MMPRMDSGLKVEAKMELSSKCWDINRFVMFIRVQVIIWIECTKGLEGLLIVTIIVT